MGKLFVVNNGSVNSVVSGIHMEQNKTKIPMMITEESNKIVKSCQKTWIDTSNDQ